MAMISLGTKPILIFIRSLLFYGASYSEGNHPHILQNTYKKSTGLLCLSPVNNAITQALPAILVKNKSHLSTEMDKWLLYLTMLFCFKASLSSPKSLEKYFVLFHKSIFNYRSILATLSYLYKQFIKNTPHSIALL